jgi:hypothetical protein
MVFKKGDSETARKGGLQRVANERTGVDKLLFFLKEGGSERVEMIYEKMLNGDEVTAGEAEFLKHYKDLMEYHTPKLSRNTTDLTSNGQTLGVIQLPMRDGLETTTKTD